MKYDGRGKKARKSRQTRMLLGSRLKVMLADLGLTPEQAGKILHVHPRTVRYWVSGKTLVPYAAYRLLRMLTGALSCWPRAGASGCTNTCSPRRTAAPSRTMS